MRTYLEFDEDNGGYPSGEDLGYECKRCNATLPSRPKMSVHCPCGGIQIKLETHEVVAIQNVVRLFRET